MIASFWAKNRSEHISKRRSKRTFQHSSFVLSRLIPRHFSGIWSKQHKVVEDNCLHHSSHQDIAAWLKASTFSGWCSKQSLQRGTINGDPGLKKWPLLPCYLWHSVLHEWQIMKFCKKCLSLSNDEMQKSIHTASLYCSCM